MRSAAVVYSAEAAEDLIGIADFIARDKPEAARRWVRHLQTTCETLASQPDMGESRPGFGVSDCRSFSVGSYVIFYRSSQCGIEVARIVHGSRDMRNI